MGGPGSKRKNEISLVKYLPDSYRLELDKEFETREIERTIQYKNVAPSKSDIFYTLNFISQIIELDLFLKGGNE